jgi:hypothetical protein
MSGASIQPFDYVTNNEFPAILLRMHDFCLISVLNDCGGVGSIFRAELKKIRAPLSPLQLREIFANYVFIYQNLKVRPSLYSNFGEDSYSICASFPEFVEVENVKEKKAVLSDLIWQYTKDSIPPFEKREEITDEVRLGKRSFLFDNTGNIVDYTKSIIQV